MLTLLLFETLDLQPVGRIKLIDINLKSSSDKKDEHVSKKMTLAKKTFTLKELLETFCDIENAKDKMLEGDPN